MSLNCKLKYNILANLEQEFLANIKYVYIFGINGENVIIITNDDLVYGYGDNGAGVIGLGHSNKINDPVVITDLCGKKISKLFGQDEFVVSLTEDGKVYTWGNGTLGQLGNRKCGKAIFTPNIVNFADNIRITDISSYNRCTHVLTECGRIYWFGYKNFDYRQQLTPGIVAGCSKIKFVEISSGWNHFLARTITGKVYTWGQNCYGSICHGHSDDYNYPSLVAMHDKVNIKKIFCGSHHNLLLSNDGNILVFGNNDHGQLGLGNIKCQVNPHNPQSIVDLIKFRDIYALENTSMAINEDMFVYIWGQTCDENILKPMRTDFRSYLDVINHYTKPAFIHKYLEYNDLFKPKNPILNTINGIFNGQKYSDLKIKIKEQIIYVHKWFVAKRCQHFNTMLSNQWSECLSNQIEIKEHSYEGYYTFLQCLYTDFIDTNNVEVLVDFLDITNEYSEEDLKLKCVNKIKALIDETNVCTLYSGSIKYSSNELRVYCFEYMVERMDQIQDTDGYKHWEDLYFRHFLSGYYEYVKHLHRSVEIQSKM